MWPLLASLATALLLLALLTIGLRRRLVVVTVSGASMEPACRPGQRLLARRVARSKVEREVGRGQVVVLAAEEPAEREPTAPDWLIIKRVAAVAGDAVPACVAALRPDLAGTIVPPGYLIILGDNPDRSHDSRHEGLIPANRVRAVALTPRPQARPGSPASPIPPASPALSSPPALPGPPERVP